MSNLRKPSEIILKDGRTLEEVLELHKKWLNCEGGERADLRGAILIGTDLSDCNLRYSDLSNSDLSCSDLRDANLSCCYLNYANLSYTDLSYANLSYANLIDTDLSKVKFYLTNLYKTEGDFVSIGNIGSRNDTTHYFYNDNRVICGCFDGTMEEFEDRVKDTYEEDDKEYKEYMIAIRTLKELAEIN